MNNKQRRFANSLFGLGAALLGVLLAIFSMPSVLFWANGILGGHSTLDLKRPEWVDQEQQK